MSFPLLFFVSTVVPEIQNSGPEWDPVYSSHFTDGETEVLTGSVTWLMVPSWREEGIRVWASSSPWKLLDVEDHQDQLQNVWGPPSAKQEFTGPLFKKYY